MIPDSQNLTIEIFTVNGIVPFTEWLDHLPDLQARARIRARVDRLETGNPERYEDLRRGLRELKIDLGPGYRVYWTQIGRTIVLLLSGEILPRRFNIPRLAALVAAAQQKDDRPSDLRPINPVARSPVDLQFP